MSSSTRRRLARDLASTWTPALAERTKRRIDARIVQRGRRRRQLVRATLAFAVASVGGLAYAWFGGRIGADVRTAPQPAAGPGVSSPQAAAVPAPAVPAPASADLPRPPGEASGAPAPAAGTAAPPSPSTTTRTTPPPHPNRRPSRALATPPSAPATSTDPVEALFAEADHARSAGRPADAVVPLTEIAERHASDPRAALAAFQLGRVYADELGDPGRAVAAFDRARALAPNGPLAADARHRADESRRAIASPHTPPGGTP